MLTYKCDCPECGYELAIEELGPENYVIKDDDSIVSSCPNCGSKLSVEDGEIVAE